MASAYSANVYYQCVSASAYSANVYQCVSASAHSANVHQCALAYSASIYYCVSTLPYSANVYKLQPKVLVYVAVYSRVKNGNSVTTLRLTCFNDLISFLGVVL